MVNRLTRPIICRMMFDKLIRTERVRLREPRSKRSETKNAEKPTQAKSLNIYKTLYSLL